MNKLNVFLRERTGAMIWKCCWCGKFLEGRKALAGELIIGGVCESCLDKFVREFELNENEEENESGNMIEKTQRE